MKNLIRPVKSRNAQAGYKKPGGSFPFLKYFLPLLLMCSQNISAQILLDSAAINLVKQGIDCIYDFRFDEADRFIAAVHEKYPDHPVDLLVKGLKIYWENYPLMPASPERDSMEYYLHKCMEHSDRKESHEEKAEYLLANLCARGLLLMFYSDNNLSLEVFPLVAGTYQGIRKSFGYTDVCADFYYFTGVYNYYRDVYPEVYPVYKPLTLLIPRGNREEGLEQLKDAAKNAIVLRAETLVFLSDIYLRYEKNSRQSAYFSKVLYDLYPSNQAFALEYATSLLINREYDEAEKIIPSSPDNLYFAAKGEILKGIIMEKKYRDNDKAEDLYKKGIKDISLFGENGDEAASFAYYGLSRISSAHNDKSSRKFYRKKGDELSDFKELNFD